MMARLLERLRESAAGQWYLAQTPRDRRMLLLLGIFVAAVVIYAGIWSPIREARREAEARYARELADYRWIVAHREEARAAAARRGRGSGGGSQALLSTVASAARNAGIELARFQPEGGDGLSIVVEDVRFDELVVWLEALRSEHGIRVRQATMDSRRRDGRVQGRIVVF